MTRRAAVETQEGSFLTSWAILVAFFQLLPIMIIVILSFGDSLFMEFPPRALSLRWYRSLFGSERWIGSMVLSLEVACLVALSATCFGTTAAIGLTRAEFKGKRLLELFLLSPIVVPTVVTAVGLYLLLSSFHLAGSILAIFLGHTVLAIPLVVLIVSAGVSMIDSRVELAARSLGASPYAAFRHITLPLILPAVLGGMAFSFLTSFDEVILAIFLSGPRSVTLPVRMWEGVRFEFDPTLTAASSVLVFLAAAIIAGAGVLTKTGELRARGRVTIPILDTDGTRSVPDWNSAKKWGD